MELFIPLTTNAIILYLVDSLLGTRYSNKI